MGNKIQFGKYKTTNGSFEEIFSGEYDLPLNFQPKSVLDIGANEGAFTAWALERWPECTVESFEPMPENAEIFLENHAANQRVIFHRAAVFDAPKLTMFRGLNNSGECSAYNLGEQRTDNSVEVDCIKAKDIPAAEFVKIDTEGCELDVLSGLGLSVTKAVTCEYHSELDKAKIIKLLESVGFELVNQKPRCQDRGVLKFAKPGCLLKKVTRSLFLAMPAYRNIDVFTCQALLKLTAEQLTKAEFGLKIKMHIGECPIGRARNDLTHEFLQSDCTHILFVDSDIIFSYEQVKKILENDEDIIGGFYVKKQDGPVAPVCNTLNGVDKPRHDGLVRVKYMGTGFLRISRKVFEVMIQERPELAYIDDRDGKTVKHDFWRMGVALDCVTGMKRWLSEDWQFCQFAIECGFNVWADASILLQHSGSITFPLRTQLPELYTPEQLKRLGLDFSAKTPDRVADHADTRLASPPVGVGVTLP